MRRREIAYFIAVYRSAYEYYCRYGHYDLAAEINGRIWELEAERDVLNAS